VKRLAASLVVAARQDGIKPKRAALAVTAAVESYATRMGATPRRPSSTSGTTACTSNKLIDYFEPADQGRVSVYIERKKKRRTSRHAFTKLTAMAHGRPRITEDPRSA